MTEQQVNPRRSVALAIVLVVLAVLVFGAAFYLLDGYALVQEYTGGSTVEAANGPGNTAETTSQVATDTLTLPDGMPEEFALRLWQEQVDSQTNIERLLSDEIESFVFTGREQDGDDTVVLEFTASLREGGSADGRIGMRRYGDVWYFSWVTGLAGDPQGGPSTTPLPSIDEVDVQLVNTMIAEQSKSTAITTRYAEGDIKTVSVLETEGGPNTSTVAVEMTGSEPSVSGDVIAITSTLDTGEMWFIARFTQG